jgi:hypothetical protein
MSRSTWDVVEELRVELQKDFDAVMGSDSVVLRLEHDFMRGEVHAWARCKHCRKRYQREDGAPLLSLSQHFWHEALPAPMPSEWVPFMAFAGLQNRRAVEVINSAHDKMQKEPREVRRYVAEHIAWSVREMACSCIAKERVA